MYRRERRGKGDQMPPLTRLFLLILMILSLSHGFAMGYMTAAAARALGGSEIISAANRGAALSYEISIS